MRTITLSLTAVSAFAFGLSFDEARATLDVASCSFLQSVTGMEEGLCCVPENGAICEANPEVANCVPGGPSECTCHLDGATCYRVLIAPKKHDQCVLPINEPVEPLQCSYAPTPEWCYKVEVGACNSDAGGWSWWHLCDLCGCDYTTGAPPREIGSRTVCAAGSSACPP